jgi:hypothetical protein
MNEHNHVTTWDFIKGYFLAILVYFINLFNGWIEHNGGIKEMVYSIMTIILYGFFGAGVSFLANRFFKYLSKK